MRAAIPILLLAGFVNVFAESTNAPSNETRMSKPMPTFALKNLAGDEISSSNYVGKIRVVLFWASWDAPCQKQIPALNDVQRTFGTNNVAVLSLVLDQKLDELKTFAATNARNLKRGSFNAGAISTLRKWATAWTSSREVGWSCMIYFL